MPRETLRALEGDAVGALLWQQATWIAEHFDGAFHAPAEWWSKLLNLSPRRVRDGLRRLEALGWLSIQRRGMDPGWWLTIHFEVGRAAIAEAEAQLDDALLWDVQGKRRNPSNGSSSGNRKQAVPVAPTAQLREPQVEQYIENKKILGRAPSGSAVAAGLSAALVSVYPHPSNGRSRVSVPSVMQVENMLLSMLREHAPVVRLDQPTVDQILAAAHAEAQIARSAPEAYRKTLKTWLGELCWQQTYREVKPVNVQNAAPPPRAKDTRSAWDELEQREEVPDVPCAGCGKPFPSVGFDYCSACRTRRPS